MITCDNPAPAADLPRLRAEAAVEAERATPQRQCAMLAKASARTRHEWMALIAVTEARLCDAELALAEIG